MVLAPDTCYTLIHTDDTVETPSVNELRNSLEKGNEAIKMDAMKKIVILLLNGETMMTSLLMHVIRFVMPIQKNKMLKKLMLLFFEICGKRGEDGKLKQEWILVCNALRNDLQHPNEYVRGVTLRFVCKLREAELLEPLVPSIRSCLEHRNAYVRRNAVFAVYSVYRCYDYLFPDASDVLYEFLQRETDMSCKRNAFHMLYSMDQSKAVGYLISVMDKVVTFDEPLQLTIVELINKDCRGNQQEKARYIKCIFSLLNSPSNAVKYESANTLVSLTAAPTAVKAAAGCYLELAVKEADNNVKLIVLERFKSVKDKNGNLLDELAVDLLRVLSSTDLEVRKKAMGIVLEMISSKNVNEMVSFLKKEIVKVHQETGEKNGEYRQLLVQASHKSSIKYGELCVGLVMLLLDYMGETSTSTATEIVSFCREVLERYTSERRGLLMKICDVLHELKHSKVVRGCLWMLGEYAEGLELLEAAFQAIRRTLGNLREDSSQDTPADQITPVPTSSRRVLPDGTYATETAITSPKITTEEAKHPFKRLIMEGDYFVASTLAFTLAKLVLRWKETPGVTKKMVNARKAESMLWISGLMRLGKPDEDSYERLMFALRILSQGEKFTLDLISGKEAFQQLLLQNTGVEASAKEKEHQLVGKGVEEKIVFRQLQSRGPMQGDGVEYDLMVATGAGDEEEPVSKLDKIVQLTGGSDSIYAEAYVDIHQYDITLDVLVVNQTADTLQNLQLELSTLGDLKLVERPVPLTIGPHGFLSIKATIKVSSSDNGVIFGNIVYDVGTVTCTIVLNAISIDIMEYIQPATCSEIKFRAMWLEFEWENKIIVKTPLTDLSVYLERLLASTKLQCIVSQNASSQDFLAANLYARTIFGEDLVANVSLEKSEANVISGHIRLRTKTQGFAYSVGEKISAFQKEWK